MPSKTWAQCINAAALSPILNVLGGTSNELFSLATRGSVITFNGSISILIFFTAAWAISTEVATTKATGIPLKCTSSSANKVSSGTMPPIWFSPGISLYVNILTTPSIFSAILISNFKIFPCAEGEPNTAPKSVPAVSGISSK